MRRRWGDEDGLVIRVARLAGSLYLPPCLSPEEKSRSKVCFVGKGLTLDVGGII